MSAGLSRGGFNAVKLPTRMMARSASFSLSTPMYSGPPVVIRNRAGCFALRHQ